MEESIWKDRELVIATMHGKEKVLGPLLEQNFGLKVIVPVDLNTDEFGTFSGEIERKESPLEAARLKCKAAMDLSGSDLGLASEGSFGPHPEFGFLNMNEEYLLLLDRRNNLEIIVKNVSLDTNLSGQDIENEKELLLAAKKMGFPSHGLILRSRVPYNQKIIKGITDQGDLIKTFNELQCSGGGVYLETDMRAMFNPKRMAVIEQAGIELINKMKSNCGNCGTPGFGPIDAEPGLPCSSCGLPTRSTLFLIRKCTSCGNSDKQYFPHNKQFEDPQFCDFCNP